MKASIGFKTHVATSSGAVKTESMGLMEPINFLERVLLNPSIVQKVIVTCMLYIDC